MLDNREDDEMFYVMSEDGYYVGIFTNYSGDEMPLFCDDEFGAVEFETEDEAEEFIDEYHIDGWVEEAEPEDDEDEEEEDDEVRYA